MSTLKSYLKKLKKINARGTDYSIKFVPHLTDEESERALYGYCDPNEKTIVINDSAPNKELLDTFMHEWLHAIWYESGISQEDVPTWVEHIYLCGITSDSVNQKKIVAKLFSLK